MIFVALGGLVLAVLVALGRKPLLARGQTRLIAYGVAAAALAAAIYDVIKGGWLGGSILLTAALWLFTSARAGAPPAVPRRHGPGAGGVDAGRRRGRGPRRRSRRRTGG